MLNPDKQTDGFVDRAFVAGRKRPNQSPLTTTMDLTMCAANATTQNLRWDVLTIKRPGLTRDLPAGKEELMWVANSSTLIYGERDAVLVDTFLTTKQSQTLLDWVVASGKNLTAIYAPTDNVAHFFVLWPFLSVFPPPG